VPIAAEFIRREFGHAPDDGVDGDLTEPGVVYRAFAAHTKTATVR
jgi:hypothetical protein